MKTQFSFPLYASSLEQYQTEDPIKIEHVRFQSYSHFSEAPNNIIQRKLNAIIGSILKSILASSDSAFCLITSHITTWDVKYLTGLFNILQYLNSSYQLKDKLLNTVENWVLQCICRGTPYDYLLYVTP